MSIQEIIQGEAKTLVFTESNGEDLTGATCSLLIKADENITKDDDDFDKTDIASGILKVPLSSTESAGLGKGDHEVILTVQISANDIDKSKHTLKVLTA